MHVGRRDRTYDLDYTSPDGGERTIKSVRFIVRSVVAWRAYARRMDEQQAHQRRGPRPPLLAYVSSEELERLAAALVEMLIDAERQRRQPETSDQHRKGA